MLSQKGMMAVDECTYTAQEVVLEVEFDIRFALFDDLEDLDGFGGDLDFRNVSVPSYHCGRPMLI